MRSSIAVQDYCAAFLTWGAVSHRSEEELQLFRNGCDAVSREHSGLVPISELCSTMRNWAEAGAGTGSLGLDIAKSCLLSRLIYAGEPLRTQPCPIHEGSWSGCPDEPCPAGCNFGLNVTGWLPEL